MNVTERYFDYFENGLDISDLDLLAIREDAFKNMPAMHLNRDNRMFVLKKGSFRGLPRLLLKRNK